LITDAAIQEIVKIAEAVDAMGKKVKEDRAVIAAGPDALDETCSRSDNSR
jgi:hypothetical protein